MLHVAVSWVKAGAERGRGRTTPDERYGEPGRSSASIANRRGLLLGGHGGMAGPVKPGRVETRNLPEPEPLARQQGPEASPAPDGGPFTEALARDPWGRVMITTPPRLPSWFPGDARHAVRSGRLREGLTEFRTDAGESFFIHKRTTAGFTEYQVYRDLPEEKGFYLERARGNEDAARRLRDVAISWNRVMRHLMKAQGLSPLEAQRKLREIDEGVFRLALLAGATMMLGAASLCAVRTVRVRGVERRRGPRPGETPQPKGTPGPKAERASPDAGRRESAVRKRFHAEGRTG